MSDKLTITLASTPADIEQVRSLFAAYQKSIGIDLCFQNFDEECENLPGDYVPPSGLLLLAKQCTKPIGCIALRKIDDDDCEMKRLYVCDNQRKTGLGRRLANINIEHARKQGYTTMRLHTLPTMTAAFTLYKSLGFVETEPQQFTPIEGVVFMALKL